jgi:formylglycine-generating enzyme required for sulfatase activity
MPRKCPGVDGAWKTQKRDGIPISDKDDHPVISVSWDDANAFCAWLSKKESRIYRCSRIVSGASPRALAVTSR